MAQYCGTSVEMIQKDYCGPLGLALDPTQSNLRPRPQQPTNQPEYEPDQTAIKPLARSYSENMVAGPGFEPGTSRL